MYIIILLLSILESILFFEKEPGISVVLFVLPIVILLIYYLEKTNRIKNKRAKLIAIPIVLISITYFIFNNAFFNDLNTLVIPALIVFMIIELLSEKFTLEKIFTNMMNFIFKPMGCIGKVGKNIINKLTKKEKIEEEKSKNIKRYIKAVLIAMPVLLVVLILLITADLDFAKIFLNIFEHIFNFSEKLQISTFVERLIGIIIMFFYLAGFIENINLTKELEKNKKEIGKKDSLAIKVILTALNVMYVVFCIIQVKHLFKLSTMDRANYSYSYYARQGFFQLMVVSAINLVMILQSKQKCYEKEKYIKIMDLCMIVLTFIILISSFIRMYLYQQNFGLTLKRILVFWAEITEGILLIPTAMYVLDKKIDLAKTYFTTIITMYVVLNFININKIIAKVNVNMYLKRNYIDSQELYYLESLGYDALPEAVKILDIENKTDESIKDIKNQYIEDLKEINEDMKTNATSWQELNLSKIRAKKK